MSYATSILTCLSQGATGGPLGYDEWLLDTVDTIADVNTAGFISDAKARGMKKGDKVNVRIWTTAVPTATSQLLSADGSDNDLTAFHLCWVVGMSAAGAADLTDGLAVTATNTD